MAQTKKRKKEKKFSIGYFFIYLILIFWAVTTIYPFVWVVNNSFKDKAVIYSDSFSVVKEVTMDNYNNAFEKQNIGNAYKTSIMISATTTIAVMILSTMMAFAMTRYRFKGKRIINMLITGSLMFPVFATIIPVYKMMVELRFVANSNILSVILPQTAGNLCFATIIMMGFLRGLPLEMEEAAYMEGAGVGRVFTKIIVPLSRSSLATVAIFTFLWSYNDLFTQDIMLRSPKTYPICKLLKEISSKYGTDFGLMAAAVTLIVIPVLIVYIFLQKNIIKGLTAGAVKG